VGGNILERVSFGPAGHQNSTTPVVVFLGEILDWVPQPLYNSHFEWVFELSAGANSPARRPHKFHWLFHPLAPLY